jgi:hypothetical protein
MIPIINILYWSRCKNALFGIPFKRLHVHGILMRAKILHLDTKLVMKDYNY